MRNERAADESAPSTLTALLQTELPPFRLTLIVEAGSLRYRRGRLFPPAEQALGVLAGAEGRVVVERPPKLGEERVVVDISGREVGKAGDGGRHGEIVLTFARLAAQVGWRRLGLGEDKRRRLGGGVLWLPLGRGRRQVDRSRIV